MASAGVYYLGASVKVDEEGLVKGQLHPQNTKVWNLNWSEDQHKLEKTKQTETHNTKQYTVFNTVLLFQNKILWICLGMACGHWQTETTPQSFVVSFILLQP